MDARLHCVDLDTAYNQVVEPDPSSSTFSYPVTLLLTSGHPLREQRSWRELWCQSGNCKTLWETESSSSGRCSRSCAATWTRSGRGSSCPTSPCTTRSSKLMTRSSPAWTPSITPLTGLLKDGVKDLDFWQWHDNETILTLWNLDKITRMLFSDSCAPNLTPWARCCQQ